MRVTHAEIITSASDRAGFPPPGPSEIAFLGRSNVGKSSLLNRLVNRKQLARTSNTPGKTRLIHFYRVERGSSELRFVDFPGYGYAKVSKTERQRWQHLIEDYLGDRPTLCAAVLLQDLRREISEDETLLVDWLAERSVPTLLALTKVDKLKPMRRAQRVKQLRATANLPAARVVATSSEKGIGIPDLWSAIDKLLRNRST
jgi:GTP-binding protein